jgi:hypothetical protein
MGSGCSGERQGQEIVDAAIWAGTQSATPLGPANLAGTRSDSNMQQKWCSRLIQRIYRSDLSKINAVVTTNYFRYVLLCVLSGFHDPAWRRVVSRKNVSRIEGSYIDPERRVREALVPDTQAPPAPIDVVAEGIARSADHLSYQRSSYRRAATYARNRPREGEVRHRRVWHRNARRKNLPCVRRQYESQNLELLVRSRDGHHHARGHHRAMRLRMDWVSRGAREAAIGGISRRATASAF